MNKTELIKHVAHNTGLTVRDVTSVIECAVGAVADSLCTGDSVSYPGFGTMSTTTRAAREGHIPATGATIAIPATRTVKFKISSTLKGKMNS